MANDLPSGFVLPTASSIEAKGRRAWLIRHNLAAPGKPIKLSANTLPAIIIAVFRDLLMPVYADASAIARETLIRNTFGPKLEARALEMGLEGFRPATKSQGHIQALQIVTNGAQILEGAQLRHEQTTTSYQVTVGKVYELGEPIPIESIDTGPTTNLAAGTVLRFVNPPAGVSEQTTVVAQNDGTGVLGGLSGGSDAETDTELQDRMIEAQADPPAAGNVAQILRVVQQAPGIAVQKAFFWPAFRGPGSGCAGFTLRPDTVTGSRIPNSVQRGRVEADIRAAFSADNSYTVATLVSTPLKLLVTIDWRDLSTGWVDPVPWPRYVAGASTAPIDHSAIVTADNGFATPTSSTCRVVTQAPGLAAPAVGQTIAFFDLATRTFGQKKILTVTAVGGQPPGTQRWDLVFDMTASASTTFVPSEGALVSPWSPSLNLLPAAVTAVTRLLGPGEQVSTFYDPGTRQRRQPDNATSWPNVLSSADLVTQLKATRALADIDPQLPPMPYATPVGVPGVLSYLIELNDLAFYPIS